MLSAGSIIGQAMCEGSQGIMLRNAKNDSAYREEVDGLIYENNEEESERDRKRVIENVIAMPIIGPKG